MAIYAYNGKLVKIGGGGYAASGGGGGGNTVTAAFTISRSSGTSPLAVEFDASTSTSNISQVTDSAMDGIYRQLYYSWNFGKTGAGNFSATGNSRNTLAGAYWRAATVFEVALGSGTTVFTVQLTVTAGSPWRTSTAGAPTAYVVGDVKTQGGSTYICATDHTPGTFATDLSNGKWTLLAASLIQSTVSHDVSVTDANTTYSTTNTIYVSPSANYTNAPAGSTHQTTVPTLASNKRIMLRGAESGYGNISIGSGLTGCQVVTDGVGARPACTGLSVAGTGNVINGLAFTAGAVLSGTDNLIMGCSGDNTASQGVIYETGGYGQDNYTNTPRGFMFENSAPASATADYGWFGSGRNVWYVGNDGGGQNQHTWRGYGNWYNGVSNNKFLGPASDSSKHALKQHSLGFVEWPTTSTTSYASGYGICGDNIFNNASSVENWTTPFEPESNPAGEGLEHFIIFQNTYILGTATSTDVLMIGRYMTFRDNTRNSGSMLISYDDPNTGVPSNWRDPYFFG